MKKIWIDLDNSPHVPFFRPIIDELEQRGCKVFLTARDAFQVRELVDSCHLPARMIGHHNGKSKIMKVFGLFYRAFQMKPMIKAEKPDIAVSHGSRTLMLLAAVLKIPSIIILDYEYVLQLPFVNPSWIMVPEIVPDNAFKINKVIKYPGIKEDVYVPRFKPDDRIRNALGIAENELLVTIRPPATEAHYHNPQSEKLFKVVIEFLSNNDNVRIVVLPRNEKQTGVINKLWPEYCNNGKIIIPDHVLDGLNLMWYSDLVVSGGGTMNREAAALGVPVYSIFRGKIGAVDNYLAKNGRLILLEQEEDIRQKIILKKYNRPDNPLKNNCRALQKIVEEIIKFTLN